MVYFLRALLIPLCILFLAYTFSSMWVFRSVDDDVMEELLDKRGFLDWSDGIKLPDRQARKEILLEAIKRSKGIKHKKLASFIVKMKDFMHVMLGITIGIFIYFSIKMIF